MSGSGAFTEASVSFNKQFINFANNPIKPVPVPVPSESKSRPESRWKITICAAIIVKAENYILRKFLLEMLKQTGSFEEIRLIT